MFRLRYAVLVLALASQGIGAEKQIGTDYPTPSLITDYPTPTKFAQVNQQIIMVSDEPSDVPSDQPSLAPTDGASDSPSDIPSVFGSALPSSYPTITENWPVKFDSGKNMISDYPSLVPTSLLVDDEEENDSSASSDVPSLSPTVAVEQQSDTPSLSPTTKIMTSDVPSSVPSASVSDYPSVAPSVVPSDAPSKLPSSSSGLTSSSNKPFYGFVEQGTRDSDVPSGAPSMGSTSIAPSLVNKISVAPSDVPSMGAALSDFPSMTPSSWAPSDTPSKVPSLSNDEASVAPSDVPSVGSALSDSPSMTPSLVPSDSPSKVPSSGAFDASSIAPSDSGSGGPLSAPFIRSDLPSMTPSWVPSDSPSKVPSSNLPISPSDAPSHGFQDKGGAVSGSPSSASSLALSDSPSTSPSAASSATPSGVASVGSDFSDIPSFVPSDFPSSQPNTAVSDQPSLLPGGFTFQPSSLFSQQGFPDPTDEPTEGSSTIKLESTSKEIMDDETVVIFEGVLESQYLPQVLPLVYPANYTGIKCTVLSQILLNDNAERKLQEKDTKQTAKIAVRTDDVKIVLRISSNVDPPAENFDELVAIAMREYPELLHQLLSNQTAYFEPVVTEDPDDGNETPPPPVAAIEETPNSDDSTMPVIIIIAAVVGGVVVALLAAFLLGQRDAYRPPATQPQFEDGCSIVFSDGQSEYPFGKVGDPNRGGMMIQTSFSSISGSNMPRPSSPGPYPLVTPLNLQVGDDALPLHASSNQQSPANISHHGSSDAIMSTRSTASAVSPRSTGSKLSPMSRGSAASPRSRGSTPKSATSDTEFGPMPQLQPVPSIENILEKHGNKYSRGSSPSIESNWNQSSVAGNVKRQGGSYTTTTISEESNRLLNMQRKSKSAGFDAIAERSSEETSWDNDAHTSTDEESVGLNGLDIIDGSCVVGPNAILPNPANPGRQAVETTAKNKPAPKSRSLFDFWATNKESDKTTDAPIVEMVDAVEGPLDSLASFLTLEDEPKPVAPLTLQDRRVASGSKPMPLTINTKHALHTGLVLDDLDDMEKEWKGQLDSTTTTTSTTPKRENRERFKKPPRQILYDGRILNDGNSI